MKHSLFELFKIGIGPSSSHTMGPMRAALRFARELESTGLAFKPHASRLTCMAHWRSPVMAMAPTAPSCLGSPGRRLKGSIRLRSKRNYPRFAPPEALELPGHRTIAFEEAKHLLFHRDQMYPVAGVASHPNGMRFSAFDSDGALLLERIFFSIGGGFIVSARRVCCRAGYPDRTGQRSESAFPTLSTVRKNFWRRAAAANITISQLMLANECALAESGRRRHDTAEQEVRRGILHIWQVMRECTQRGIETEGILPGGLKVRRRAAKLAARLRAGVKDPLSQLDWITVYAMAVNEENAAGGRVVTAPTNGAAGVIPAVAHYYLEFVDGANEEGILRYFLTAAAIGILYKENASISGAEVGCQGEVGVACSMAAGGLVSAINAPGETSLTAAEINDRIEHAAEIGMEHHLGMTCDPIGGLVQVPCIERNAVGAIKAVNASRMAMNESEGHKVSLDQVIKTMYQTGLDMQARYKETSLAGLALNVIEC